MEDAEFSCCNAAMCWILFYKKTSWWCVKMEFSNVLNYIFYCQSYGKQHNLAKPNSNWLNYFGLYMFYQNKKTKIQKYLKVQIFNTWREIYTIIIITNQIVSDLVTQSLDVGSQRRHSGEQLAMPLWIQGDDTTGELPTCTPRAFTVSLAHSNPTILPNAGETTTR
jgi:hypothetical protein